MSAENTAMLERVDASVAIAGELKADVTLNFDFADEPGSTGGGAEGDAVGGGEETARPSGTDSAAASLPVPDNPFSSLPERAPTTFNPYAVAFKAGFIPCHPPTALLQQ